jgi:hypothetical protein
MATNTRLPIFNPSPKAASINFNASFNNQGLHATGNVSGVPVLGPIKGSGSVSIDKKWGQPAQVQITKGLGF